MEEGGDLGAVVAGGDAVPARAGAEDREEYILRRYPDGKVLGSGKGSVRTMPGGEKWVLE